MKPNVFNFSHYKDYLRSLTEPPAPRGEMSRLARVMGCQAAYLSQVMRGKAELTEDHMYRLVRSLEISPRAADYLMTLLRAARATSFELRGHLEECLEKMRIDQEKENVDIQAGPGSFQPEDLLTYFATWMPSTLHIATCCPRLQTVSGLVKRFSIPEAQVREILEFLRQKNLVEQRNERWEFKGAPLHFPKSSPAYQTSQFAHRQQTARAIEIADPRDLHFSSIFAADANVYDLLKKNLSNYIEQSHREINASESVDVYAMTLDLYKVK